MFYDFTGTLPVSLNYPNLIVSNSTSTNHVITFANTVAYTLALPGNFTTLATEDSGYADLSAINDLRALVSISSLEAGAYVVLIRGHKFYENRKLIIH